MSPFPIETPIPNLQDKVIAITGAASGIGLATAHVLAKSGANLSISDVSPIEPVIEELQKHYGVKVTGEKVDVRNAENVASWINNAVSHFGRLDGAANVAGISGATEHLGELRNFKPEVFELVMGINCTGIFNSMKAELAHLEKDAAIVNVASVAGLVGCPNMFAYGVSKAAVISMTKSAAREEGKRNIRVNAVCPGVIDTPMVDAAEAKFGRSIETTKQCLERKANPVEVGRFIAFLLSDDATFMTGGVYTVDGGYMA